MASQLTNKDKLLLDANLSTRVGLKPYEDGVWGSQGNKDFVHFQLFDENNNLIQDENLSFSKFELNTTNNNIEFYPGNHIRNLGYESGVFNVRYNFLRKLAGDESPVLLHTVNKGDTKVGDVYTNTNNIYITEDSLVYSGTEEEYRGNPSIAEQLAIEDLKYRIDEISPSRTEVRLKAKKINGSYMDDFIDIQTAVKLKEVNNNLNFIGGDIYDSIDLMLTPEAGGFLFTQKMVDGTITIPDIYQVDQIEVPVKTKINIIKNPSGESVFINDLGQEVDVANTREWDTTLHEDAIRVENWSDGFNGHTGGTFAGTAHIGYHAHWVRGEGLAGGNCMVFPDQNAAFIDLPEWPNEQRYRWLGISQQMPSLQGKGVKNHDIVNISLDVRSTVANKGVQLSLRYADELISEDRPTLAPAGFYEEGQSGPTETQPTDPPEGYQPNTMAAAVAVEPQPPETETQMLNMYGGNTGGGGSGGGGAGWLEGPPATGMVSFQSWIKPLAPDFGLRAPEIGDVNNRTTLPGQMGAWKIENIFDDGETVYAWRPNLEENLMIGATSLGEEWVWDGYLWVASPNVANYPSPPTGTVNNILAVNHHPYVQTTDGDFGGDSLYRRETNRGQNRGWQTGTIFGSLAIKHVELFKDDLVWTVRADDGTDDNIIVKTIEEWAGNDLFRTIEVTGQDGIVRKLYDDIFETGFIQSVTRPKEAGTGNSNDDVRSAHYYIFYNDGRGDVNTSNKFFHIEKGTDGKLWRGSNEQTTVSYLTEVCGGSGGEVLNNAVNAADLKFEVSFKSDFGNNKFVYYWLVGGRIHFSRDGNGDITNDTLNNDDNSYPADISNKFEHISNNIVPDVLFPKDPSNASDEISNFMVIIDDRVIKANSGTDGISWDRGIQEYFYNAGIVGTGGADLTYGVRNPGATNYGVHDEEGNVIDEGTEPIYDIEGRAQFDYEMNPTREGTLSPLGVWKWSGNVADGWISNALTPPRYNYTSPQSTRVIAAPDQAGEWQHLNFEIPIPNEWELPQKWFLYIYGDGAQTGAQEQGVVWVDNLFMDFTLRDQSETIPVYKPYSAQIKSVKSEGTVITVDKTIREVALGIGANDDDEDGNPDIYNLNDDTVNFSSFKVSYLNLNPKDLRTYLKFDNNLFLTTNFKADRVNLTTFPYSVVYKMYEPLPDNYEKFDECIIVKEMANPLEERIKIIDFINEEEPKLVLRSPDLNNVESPVQRRETQFKTEADILTSDSTISTELRNEFLSQSLDSVEINTDYSRFVNFINFGSSEVRVRNFKRKLEDIETYKVSSASYIGVSGSSADSNLYHHKIEDVKNNFDTFEKYMYFESSSYVTSSLGEFHDNAWPKTSGAGTIPSPYILAHTTSSQATTWINNTAISASEYDDNNLSKLSTLVPEHIKIDDSNITYLRFTDMIGQHFDHIWEYVNALSDTYDRRDKLDEGISKDLLWSVAKSLGWNLNDGKDLINLPRYALGKEVTGSAYSDYSATSERDMSREIWSRIINNMPFFLKNKGTVRALKGLINIYGIPSTILRVKEYGGPDLPDNATPQFEITRKFTKALDFKGSQYVKVAWANDDDSSRKPDTVELRFRAATGSNQILVEKQDANNQDWFIRLQDNGSTDNYGSVSFMLSGSAVGKDLGQYKEISSSALPVYDGDFYSVMVRRMVGSDDTSVSQSYELNVGKYDSSRNKIHLYSTTTMDVTQAASSSFSNAWTGSGDIYIGGSADLADVGVQFSGSVMEYRHWTEVLNTGSFKNHVANPKAYDGNTVSSSYENLVLRYSMNDNKDLSSDTAGIRDVSSNQTSTLSGSHSGFTGNFFRNVVDELKTHIPSIGALRRVTNKVRIEANKMKSGYALSSEHRATDSAYDTAPNDSNKVGIWFAPTDVINNDIINSVGNLNFDNYLGDPRDRTELSYRGLNYVADNYWKKYTSPNNFWDYMRMIKYYDQSMYPQLRKLIPARAKPDIGLLIEPNIFERPKVVIGKTLDLENRYYSSSIDVTKEVMVITGSFNAGLSITDYEAYTGRIDMYSYETGSSVVSASGEYLTFEATGSEARDRFINRSIWQRLNENDEYYSDVTMSFGDTLIGVKGGEQAFISGSRVYGINKKITKFYSTIVSSSLDNYHSSSFYPIDLDNFSHLNQGLRNSYYIGVKNNNKTTSDGNPPIEVIISAPTKLVTTDEGESTLKTGDGIIPDFKESDDKDDKQLMITYEQQEIKNKGRKLGLKGLTLKLETDLDRKKHRQIEKIQKDKAEGKLVMETTPADQGIKIDDVSKEIVLKSKSEVTELKEQLDKLKEDGVLSEVQVNKLIDDGILDNKK